MVNAQNRKRRRRELTADVVTVNIVGYALMGLFALMCIFPFYLVIVASITPEQMLIRNGYPLYPVVFDLQSYALCLKNPASILTAYLNTFGVTIAGTACAVFLASMTGYVLSRQDFPYRNKFSFFFFFTTLFHGGLVPWYILCVRYLKLKNSYLALILPLMFSVWNMIIAKSFMKGIPSAITESAKIDGANDFSIFIRLILPLSKPLLATLTLFSALAYWNDWFNNMLFVTKDEMFMLQYYLQRMLANAEALKRVASSSGISIPSLPLEGMKMAMTIIATGPIVLMYPLVQRYFVKGLTIGAVKG